LIVTAAVLVFGMGAYGASGWAYNMFQGELPGGDAKVFGTEVDRSQTIAGQATVTVEWAYADTKFVVIGYSVKDLKEDRRNAGNPAGLTPVLVDERLSPPNSLPPDRVDLTDEDGGEFDVVSGTVSVNDEKRWPWPLANTAVFEAPEGLKPGERHRFRFRVPLEEHPFLSEEEWKSRPNGVRVEVERKPPVGPFVFDFEIPVRSTATVEVNQKVEASGVEVRLGRVVNSPGRPQAVVCFEPPRDGREWRPVARRPSISFLDEPMEVTPQGRDCWSVPVSFQAGGRSSLTVTELRGIPTDGAARERIIRGPWKFTFEVPEP
jgi:hypothetical protein